MGALLNDLKIARSNEDFNDVSLAGIDGGASIPASRLILSMRSPVFHKMCYGPFKESSSLSLPLLYSSKTLENLVQYCYTDSVPNVATTDNSGVPVLMEEEEIRELVRLRSAADFFALPELGSSMTNRLSSLITEYPYLACMVLDELYTVGAAESPLGEICLDIVRVKGEDVLLPQEALAQNWCGVGGCCPEVLAMVLAEAVVGRNCDDMIARCINRWETAQPELLSGAAKILPAAARDIAARIRLNRVSATHLSKLMYSSLFSKDAIYEAFRHHAMSAEQTGTAYVPPGAGTATARPTRSCCIVKSAVVDEANGIYNKAEIAGPPGGIAVYHLPGTYMSEPATFKIFPTMAFRRGPRSFDEIKEWNLCVARRNSPRDIQLYRANPESGDPEKPPMKGWQAISAREINRNPPTEPPRLVVLYLK